MKKTLDILRTSWTGISLLIILNTGCEEQTEILKPDDFNTTFKFTEYNNEINNLAIAFSKLLSESYDLRASIKKSALMQFDGDYDILITSFIDEEVILDMPDLSKGYTSGHKSTIRSLLNERLERMEHLYGSKNSESLIDLLIGEYPLLQISVPLHAEEWDEKNYIPDVTFIPEEYDEGLTEYVTGYNSKGEKVLIDAVNPPDEPVIVIGINERIDQPVFPKGQNTPAKPINLTGITTDSGIQLVWEMPDTTSDANTSGYYIRKKGPFDESFGIVNINTGSGNRIYRDNDLTAGAYYVYYVQSFYQDISSPPSNYISVKAPSITGPVLSFEAIPVSKTSIKLRWQNNPDQYIEKSRIYGRVVGQDPQYNILAEIPPTEKSWTDSDFIPGTIIHYSICNVTPVGESNAKYDYVYAPYRDISQRSPVYIKQIEFDSWKLEGWLAGKPEFYIVATISGSDGLHPVEATEPVELRFNSRKKYSQIFSNKQIANWQPESWYDVLTVTALEYDRPSGGLKYEVTVKYNIKNEDEQLQLVSYSGLSHGIKFKHKGEKCGSSYLNYFDNPDKWLQFPEYGLRILISESDN
jgi:hypothetical protein